MAIVVVICERMLLQNLHQNACLGRRKVSVLHFHRAYLDLLEAAD